MLSFMFMETAFDVHKIVFSSLKLNVFQAWVSLDEKFKIQKQKKFFFPIINVAKHGSQTLL